MYDNLKFDLSCAARILHRAGLSAGIAGHLSIALDEDKMLVNRFGPSFATVKPDDVLTLDLEGNILDGRGYVNDAILLHGVIHKANPDIGALAHCHPPGVVTFSALRKVPEAFDQESCLLAGEVVVAEEDYRGLVDTKGRAFPMARALQYHNAIIMPNHGAITQGPDMRMAAIRMLTLEAMVQRNMAVAAAAQATGIRPRPMAPEVAMETKRELNGLAALHLVWDDLIVKLRMSDPELFYMREQLAASSVS